MVCLALLCVAPLPACAQELMPSNPTAWASFAARPDATPTVQSLSGSPYALEVFGNGVPSVYGGWRTRIAGLSGNAFYRFRTRVQATDVPSPRESITILLRWRGAFGDEVAPDYVWKYSTQADGQLIFDRIVQAPPGTSSVDIELVLQWAANGRVKFDALSFAPAPAPPPGPVKVAAMSYRPSSTSSGLESVQRAARYGEEVAAAQRPDVMVFGELLNVIGSGGTYDAKAETIPGPSTDVMSALARGYNTYVAFGMLEREGRLLYNSAVLLDRSGAIVGKYRKLQLPTVEVASGITPGSTMPVFETDFGRVALLICQDTAFPEPARDAAIRGAELLLVPIWGGKAPVVAARAIEQSVYVAASGYDYLSEIVDPLGTVVRRVPVLNQPDAAVATIDLARRFREDWSGDWRDVSNKQRRKEPYTADEGPGGGDPPPPPPQNMPPTSAISSPSGGASFTAPAAIPIAVSAADGDGTVTRVDLYANGTAIASDTSSPFEFTWSNVSAGTYALTAAATDNTGATAMSAAVNVTVTNPPPPGSLPAPWQTQDIGAVGTTGTASASGGTFMIEGAGADIWGAADAFRYVWQPITGDVDVIARVASIENVAPWVKAGVMIRETLTADARHGLMLVSPGKGLAFQRRAATGGISTSTSGIGGTAPAWVKLERRGTTLSAYYSWDGASWSLVASDTIAMGASAYVGLAVSSHDPAQLATATFDSVTIRAPSGWQSQDIGAVGVAGSMSESGGTFTVRGAGADVWGSSDAFQFVWQRVSGDRDVIARVASIENVAQWVKTGVMIREQLTADSAHAFMIASAGKGLAFQRRIATGGLSTSTSGGAGAAPVWVKLERRGTTISAYQSADGVAWTLVGSDSFSMAADVYIGLAVSSHDSTRAAAATFDRVTIR